ncbi:MAG: hypothetical protein ABIH78_02395 [Candidatus Peregrinibacteria bacterium]
MYKENRLIFRSGNPEAQPSGGGTKVETIYRVKGRPEEYKKALVEKEQKEAANAAKAQERIAANQKEINVAERVDRKEESARLGELEKALDMKEASVEGLKEAAIKILNGRDRVEAMKKLISEKAPDARKVGVDQVLFVLDDKDQLTGSIGSGRKTLIKTEDDMGSFARALDIY